MGKGVGQSLQRAYLRVILMLLWPRDCVTHVEECRKIDIVALVVDVVVPLFLMELDSSSKRLWQDSMNGPTPDVPIEDLFSLYRRTKVMMDMYNAFCTKWVRFPPIISSHSNSPQTVAMQNSTLAGSLNHTSDNGWSTQMTGRLSGSKP